MSPFTMIVGVDLTEYAEAVLEHGLDQALRHDEATVRVVTVIPKSSEEDEARGRLVALVRQTFEDAVPADRRDDLHVVAHVRRGNPAEEIVELAEESLAGLIVVGRFGAHGRGSTADPIVEAAGCPVLVVPPPRDRTAASQQCADCVEIRRVTDGEQWFCARHHGEHLGYSGVSISAIPDDSHAMW